MPYPPLFTLSCPLVLASGSPRRRQFLQEWGLPFTVDVPQGPEPHPMPGESPAAYALRAARGKGAVTAARHPGALTLAADTVVTVDGDILGKPGSERDALSMLRRLAGRTHQVVTGVCLILPDGTEQSFSDSTDVTFAPWPHTMLAAYARTGEPADKAGAYAIQGQGAFLVERISGSWSTVVGLPITEIARRLAAAGLLAPVA